MFLQNKIFNNFVYSILLNKHNFSSSRPILILTSKTRLLISVYYFEIIVEGKVFTLLQMCIILYSNDITFRSLIAQYLHFLANQKCVRKTNQNCPNIQLTNKIKENKKNLLMYLFTPCYEKNKLEMEMFRGKTNKNFCLNWSSHLYHEKYIIELKNVIQNFIQIQILICFHQKSLHDELDYLKKFFIKINDYSHNLVNDVKKLELERTKKCKKINEKLSTIGRPN